MSQLVRYLTQGEINPIDTLTGNSGGPVPPTLGNINIVGTGAITVTGNPGTSTLTISSTGAGITITGDSGGALGPSTAFTFTGGSTGITFSGAGTTETLTGTLNVAHGGTGDTSFTTYAPICGGTTTTGVLQSASTGMATSGFVLTSNGSAALPTWQAPAASGITTINGDSGSVTGSAVTFNANSQAGSSVKFTGSGTTMSFNVTDINDNIIIGKTAGNGTLSGQFNTLIGENAGHSLTTSAQNAGLGYGALAGATSGGSNTAIGYLALNDLSTGSNNTAIGHGALNLISNAINNVAVGSGAGGNYTGAESFNVLLNSAGVLGESHTLHIGDGTGTGTRQLNAAFISGINGIAIPSSSSIMAVSSTDQVTSSSTMKIDSSNRVTNTAQPAFFAYQNAVTTNNTGDGTSYTVIFNSTTFDQNSNYNTGTGNFTAPVTGKYMLTFYILIQNATTSNNVILQIVTTSMTYTFGNVDYVGTGNNAYIFSVFANMSATDTAHCVVTVSGGTKTVGVYGGVNDPRTTFHGYLVC